MFWIMSFVLDNSDWFDVHIILFHGSWEKCLSLLLWFWGGAPIYYKYIMWKNNLKKKNTHVGCTVYIDV